MANKIQVKRGVEANIPILDVGEPAFTTDTKKLFIGTDTGNMELATKAQINTLDAEVIAHKAENDETARFNKNVQHSKIRPIVTFISDDGTIADWNKLKPLSETYGIPFVSALISSNIGMSQEQVLTLQNTLGWEIASHGKSHVALASLATESEIEAECRDSKEELTSLGYNVKNIVYPYGSADERVRRIAKQYYNCGTVTGGAALVLVPPVSTFGLSRVALGSYFSDGQDTLEYYKSRVDECIASNGWLIFMLHPADVSHTLTQQQYLEQVIQYIQSNNVDVMTLNDGLNIFGNAFEAGDYVNNNKEYPVITKQGKLINFPNNLQVIPKTGITNDTPITSNLFPNGVMSATTVLNTDGAGFPSSSGTLITSKLDANNDLNFQLFFPYSSSRMVRRGCASNVWQPWEEFVTKSYVDTNHPYQIKTTTNAHPASDPITAYPQGKITTFYYNSAGSTGYPASAGMVITYRLYGNGYDRQELRAYKKNAVWSRYVSEVDGSWTAWEKISAV